MSGPPTTLRTMQHALNFEKEKVWKIIERDRQLDQACSNSTGQAILEKKGKLINRRYFYHVQDSN